jgi:endogenous inhibitor of DNA gyrase (YacG/DUF329 family)
MKCPICKKKVEVGKTNPSLPFCSERCKMVDLGKWLDGKYTIPDDLNRPSDPNGNESDD